MQHKVSLRLSRLRLLFPVYQCWYGNSSCCPGGTILLPSGSRTRARLRQLSLWGERRETDELDADLRVCCFVREWMSVRFGGVVLRLSGAVTEAPWRLARKPSGPAIHTATNVIALTANEHLVAMELTQLCDTQSVRKSSRFFVKQIQD